MEDAREIWEDIEEAREKLRVKRRQITGGDIEDEVVLKSESVVYLIDEAFDLMDSNLGAILKGLQDGLYSKKEDDDHEGIEEDLQDLVSIIKEKRRIITHEKLEDKLEDLWEDIEDRFEKLIGRKDD
jgi:hypothetical protein